jgi:hypothetical protein
MMIRGLISHRSPAYNFRTIQICPKDALGVCAQHVGAIFLSIGDADMTPGNMSISETGRNEWIDTPDTKGRTAALRYVLLAICLISAALLMISAVLLVAASAPAPADLQDIALAPIL